jgi:hypothetical protein
MDVRAGLPIKEVQSLGVMWMLDDDVSKTVGEDCGLLYRT